MDQTIFLPMEDAYTLAATKGILLPSAPKICPGDVNAVLIRDLPGQDPGSIEKGIRRIFSLLLNTNISI